jgi:RNA polymerase sigma factor (sigma-70 family)
MQRPGEERFRAIYVQHRAAVTAYVRRRTTADAVEDVVADTFAVCWRKLDTVPSEALPWLYAVARKTLANHQRASLRKNLPLSEDPAAGEVELQDDPILGVAFARLGVHDREVLRLVAWEQLSFREASMVLACSAVACRVRFHRAKRRLARHLEQLETATAGPQPRPHPKGANP